MLLATAIEAAPFTILGDAPVAPPAGLPHWLQVVLYVLVTVVPLVVTVASFVAQFVNAYDRAQRKRGEKQATWFIALAASLNALAFNGDKTIEQAKAAKGGES